MVIDYSHLSLKFHVYIVNCMENLSNLETLTSFIVRVVRKTFEMANFEWTTSKYPV